MTIIDLIKGFEGLRYKPYTDTLGRLTIGYGRCLDTKGISFAEAEAMLGADIDEALQGVISSLPWAAELDNIRLNVLVCMAFQLGIGGLMQFKDMLTACEHGNYSTASIAMLDSLWAKQTPARADTLSHMMKNGL